MVNIIGQTELLRKIDDGIISRFMIIQGEEGSGKGLLSQYIAEKHGFNPVVLQADTIEFIDEIDFLKNSDLQYIVILEKCEAMHPGKRHALLKILEELNTLHVIFSTTDMLQLPIPILNRALIFNMYPYSLDELKLFCQENEIIWNDEQELKICQTPGNLLLLKEIGADTFMKSFLAFVSDLQAKDLYTLLSNIETYTSNFNLEAARMNFGLILNGLKLVYKDNTKVLIHIGKLQKKFGYKSIAVNTLMYLLITGVMDATGRSEN